MTPSCDNCGACCLGMGVPPFGEWQGDVRDDSDDPEFDALPESLKHEIVAATEVEDWAFKPCIWFDTETRRCKHYELRPVICESFEPGNPICLDDRRMAILKGFLPPEAADSGGREQSEE